MVSRLVHRGPDDDGIWSDRPAGLTLGFRRLSIIDLTPTGHQPMTSASQRYTLVFNGEVYNFLEIRDELAGAHSTHFRGRSDTEVILAAFDRWGVTAAVQRFVGMFAIAVWDARNRQLSLIRDRLGIKPLFYTLQDGVFAFASELKALAVLPAFDRSIDVAALDAFLRYLYVPAPRTIYRAVRKLLPGHILTISADQSAALASQPYWSLEDAYERGHNNPFLGTDEDAVSELQRLLSDAVRLRMRSDVPMGALLSGGIDSSVVVAIMQSLGSQRTRTFTIAFPGSAHDEAGEARRVAAALDTEHCEMPVGPEDALAVVPTLPDLFDEPLADPSQIPTFLVSKLARQHVTVALTGDGGDELFGGYERYVRGEPLIRRLDDVPVLPRRLAAAVLGAASAEFWDRAYGLAAPLLDRSSRQRLVGVKVRKLANLLREKTANDMYRSLLSAWQEPRSVLSAGGGSDIDSLLNQKRHLPLFDRMLFVDQQTYLADDLLAKVDRASMAVSLEARVPILDHRIVEFSWRLDRHLKIRDGRGKWILREVLYKYLDRELVERPKVGFSVPIAEWLRGPLRTWASDILFTRTSSSEEMLSSASLRATWTRLLKGADEAALALWAALIFESWRRRWLN